MPPQGSERTDGRSRRSLLKAGAGAVASAAAAASAGCIATLPPLGQRIRYGRVDAPDPGPPVYRRWVPARSALPYEPPDPIDQSYDATNVMYATPGNLGRDVYGGRFPLWSQILKSELDYLGVDFETIDRAIGVQSATVAEFDVDRSLVSETLTESGYARHGTYHGYDLFSRSDVPRVVAVGDEAVIQARHDTVSEARDRVRPVIDAGAGRVQRRHETDETFRAMTDLVGSAPSTSYGPWLDPTDQVQIGALNYDFDEDGVYFNHYNRYPEGVSPPVDALKRRLEERTRSQNSVAVDVQTDGRIATIEVQVDHAHMREHSSPSEELPQITWGVDHDRSEGTVTFLHEAGDSVDAERLFVRETERRFSTEYDRFGPGDAFTVDLDRPDLADPSTLAVAWESADGDSMSTLFTYNLT